MRIKKLELLGFKSFKDKTVISFDEGITGIVGPNGCGKSNIVDALVWVMGEMSAKHLRGSSMEDVIFAGSQDYAPTGMAEVSLTLENDGGAFPVKYLNHSEVMVTRRLHRGGESEYFLNKEVCRLKDIQEIFMDTGAGSKGFSIIEQGQIGKIITSKPSERRSLIEEAAGITKFKARKKESERKLKSTEQNLVRLADIIRELKRQLDSLERQAQKAERYRKLKNQLKDMELWQASLEIDQGQNKFETLSSSVEEFSNKDSDLEAEITKLEASIEEEKTHSLDKEKFLEQKQEEFKSFSENVLKEENEIRELGFEIEQTKRSSEIKGSVFEQQQSRLNVALSEKQTVETDYESVKTRFELLDEEYSNLDESFQTYRQEILEHESELTESRKKHFEVQQGITHLNASFENLEEKIVSVHEEIKEKKESQEEIEHVSKDLFKRHKDLTEAYESEKQMKLDFLKDSEALKTNLDELKVSEEKLTLQKEQDQQAYSLSYSKLESLKSLQEQFEGFQEGVKNLLVSRKNQDINEPGKPLSEWIKVPEDFETAVESCLGDALQGLFGVESLNDITESLKLVRDAENTGRAQFFVNEFINKSVLSGANTEYKNLGQFVVSKDAGTTSAVSNLLSIIYLVSDLDEAKAVFEQSHGYCITKSGELVSSLGQLYAGSSSSGVGLLTRQKDIEELTKDVAQRKTALEALDKKRQSLKTQIEQTAKDLEEAKVKDSEQDFKVFELKKELERAEFEREKAQKEIDKITDSVLSSEEKLKGFEVKKEEFTAKLEELSQQKVELELKSSTAEESLENLRHKYADIQEEVTEKKVEHASLKSEMNSLGQRLDALIATESELNIEIEKLKTESEDSASFISEHAQELSTRKAQLESDIAKRLEMERHVSKLRDEYEQATQAEREMSTALSEFKIEKSKVESKLNESQIKLEQVGENLQNLVNQMFEKYNTDLTTDYKNFVDLFNTDDSEEIEASAKDIKDKIIKMGEVNLSAIGEFDDIKTRYEFLSSQEKDLIKAKSQLERVIVRIDKICSTRFKETFEAVNERFKKVFPVLFGGGEARLILIEAEDESKEDGIDIEAKPPGKKAQNVSLLSGGEKALTAVSLIFSIFLVKPSPYCLLDEVDAPLDDANVFRFNDLVKEMAKRSQIILVTHNKNTMAVNNKLYGVTQEERGVSKMVSVDLDGNFLQEVKGEATA